MEIDSSTMGEKADNASTKKENKKKVEEVGASREGSPPFKRQRTGTSEAEGMGDEQLLQNEIPYG